MKYIFLVLTFLIVGCSHRVVHRQQASQDQIIESMTTTDDYVSLYGGYGYGYMYMPWGLYNNGFYTHSYWAHYTTPIVIDRSRHYYSSSRNQTGIQKNNNYSGRRDNSSGRINSRENKVRYQTQKSTNYYKNNGSTNNNKSGSRNNTTTSPKTNSPSKTYSSPKTTSPPRTSSPRSGRR